MLTNMSDACSLFKPFRPPSPGRAAWVTRRQSIICSQPANKLDYCSAEGRRNLRAAGRRLVWCKEKPGIVLLHAVEHHRSFRRHLVAELDILLLGGKVRKHTTHGSPLGRTELRQCLNNLGCAHAQHTTPAVPVGQVQLLVNACGVSASPGSPLRRGLGGSGTVFRHTLIGWFSLP